MVIQALRIEIKMEECMPVMLLDKSCSPELKDKRTKLLVIYG